MHLISHRLIAGFSVNKESFTKLILLSIVLCQLLGCGTLATRDRNLWGNEYLATQCSAELLIALPYLGISKEPRLLLLSPMVIPLTVIDTGFSVATDTILLPIDLAHENSGDRHNPCGFHSFI